MTISYTGANVSYTVPAGVGFLRVKAWGAGGGGGNTGVGTDGGGGGAYAFSTIAVTPGEILTLVVGGGGGLASSGFGVDGRGATGTSGASLPGGGGGGTCVKRSSTVLVQAGGGAGGNSYAVSGDTEGPGSSSQGAPGGAFNSIGTTVIAGSGMAAANQGDANYSAGIGNGGVNGWGGVWPMWTSGTNGKLVLY